MSAARIDHDDDIALARHVAETAGDVLLTLQRSGLFSASSLGKAGDRCANDVIMAALRHHRPHDAILSEEEKDVNGGAKPGQRGGVKPGQLRRALTI